MAMTKAWPVTPEGPNVGDRVRCKGIPTVPMVYHWRAGTITKVEVREQHFRCYTGCLHSAGTKPFYRVVLDLSKHGSENLGSEWCHSLFLERGQFEVLAKPTRRYAWYRLDSFECHTGAVYAFEPLPTEDGVRQAFPTLEALRAFVEKYPRIIAYTYCTSVEYTVEEEWV